MCDAHSLFSSLRLRFSHVREPSRTTFDPPFAMWELQTGLDISIEKVGGTILRV